MTVIDLSGRVAIVTGASRGIGRAAAETLLKAGATVVLNARASDEASASFAELEKAYPDRVTAVYGSVADSATATALIQSAMKHKRLDILVNNAGILRDKLIGMISDAEINELFDVNIIGLIKITQLAARLMSRRKSGSIINISSIVGRRGNSGQTVYSATKAAVIGATFSAAKELGADEHSRQRGGAGPDPDLDDRSHPRGQTQEPGVANPDGPGRRLARRRRHDLVSRL